MPFTREYRAKIEEILSSVVPIRTRAMFGGVGIYANDLVFALIDDDRLYFKVDETNQSDFETAGMSAFVPYDGAKPMAYFELPPSVLDEPKELTVWIDKAIGVAARAKSAKKR